MRRAGGMILLCAVAAVVGGRAVLAAPPSETVRVEAALSAFHGPAPAEARAFDDDDVRELLSRARDTSLTVLVRARALTLVGARPSTEVRALWAQARLWPERPLRLAAARAQAAHARAHLDDARQRALGLELLEDPDAGLRAVGVDVIAHVPAARARLYELSALDEDPRVRALAARRLR